MTKMNILAPLNAECELLETQTSLFACYDSTIVEFLQAFSQQLLGSSEAKQHSELIALGFWLRRANLLKMKQYLPTGLIKPLGTVVHFTPANVDTMFVYSWVCSLLMGNSNIVRIATQDSELRDTLLVILNTLFIQPEFVEIGRSNVFVQYDKQSEYSATLSQVAAARVIWGGDDSVNAIRALPCSVRCRDISFADRYSACLINGDKLNDEEQIEALAVRLHKDTQPYEQQACSSPRILFWSGNKDSILPVMQRLNHLSAQHSPSITRHNNHLVYRQLVASQMEDVQPIFVQQIMLLDVPKLTQEQRQWHSGEGIYLLTHLTDLHQLAQHCDTKLQTLSYWGFTQEQMLKVLDNPSITGLDRVVPVGQALDFSPVWDGFDIFNQLCRRIVLE